MGKAHSTLRMQSHAPSLITVVQQRTASLNELVTGLVDWAEFFPSVQLWDGCVTLRMSADTALPSAQALNYKMFQTKMPHICLIRSSPDDMKGLEVR